MKRLDNNLGILDIVMYNNKYYKVHSYNTSYNIKSGSVESTVSISNGIEELKDIPCNSLTPIPLTYELLDAALLICNRGGWHFGKYMILLEKPSGYKLTAYSSSLGIKVYNFNHLQAIARCLGVELDISELNKYFQLTN